MSRKKTPKTKGASAPAASALPAANGSRPARPGTARPVPQARPNGPPQPGRPSIGGGDFYDVAFKVMLVGDSGVGKTCLLVRFKDGAFLAGTFISTVGIDFRNKVLDVDGAKVKLQIWDTAGQERFRSVTHAYYRDAHGELAGMGAGASPGKQDTARPPGALLPWPLLRGKCPGGAQGRQCGGCDACGCGRQEGAVDPGGVLTGPPPPALLLLYDVTNKASFDNIQAWLTETQEYAQHDVVLMLLGNKVDSAQERAVKREDGEKLAKVSQGRVGGQWCPWGPGLGLSPPGRHLAGSTCLQEYGLPFMETSAKTGLNVDLAFTAIAKELKQRSMKAPSEPRFRLHDYVKREGRSASCCIP
ncbi:ras-related protein Rab-26 isoform X2 [Meles meles]|uniref:ras-related protein Rab-26 isoform X2 n=1 Tax=Meles meles TaxID=9662 RepID=UPI001E698EAB|nr:ras-related protein Rab-26 isoform X2 [Meles meles]